jgi:hypothetical protein
MRLYTALSRRLCGLRTVQELSPKISTKTSTTTHNAKSCPTLLNGVLPVLATTKNVFAFFTVPAILPSHQKFSSLLL